MYPALHEVLGVCHARPFTTSSDYARLRAKEIALAASAGWITVLTHDGQWGATWRLTIAGLATLNSY